MMCTQYSNMYGCRDCENFIKSESIEVTGTDVIVKLPNPTKTLVNGQRICMCLIQDIPVEATSETTVTVDLGGTKKVTLVTNRGNIVHGDQLRTRRVYHGILATDTEALVIPAREACRTRFAFPTIPVVPVP